MSTKIFNGYRLVGVPDDIKSVCDFLHKVGEKVRAVASVEADRFVARLAIELIDQTVCGLPVEVLGYDGKRSEPNDAETPMSLASRTLRMRVREVKISSYRDPAVDFSCEVTILPSKVGPLALLFTESRAIKRTWESTKVVRAWPYWNNVDPPKDVSEADWEERGNVWDAALLDHAIPARAGLSMTLVAEGYDGEASSRGRIAKFQVSLPRRVRSIAYDIVLYRKIDELMKASGAPMVSRTIPEEVHQGNSWMRSDEGQAAVAQESAKVQAKLKPRITAEDLARPIGDWKPK